jgi:hypothetical protein
MPPILYASFLAGSLLTLLVPIALLVAIVVWYLRAVRHVPQDTPTSSAVLPPPEVLAAAEAAAPDPPDGSP